MSLAVIRECPGIHVVGWLRICSSAISVSVIKACPNILYPWLGLENVLEFMSEVKKSVL